MLNNFCAFDPPGCCRRQQVNLSENPRETASLCQSWWSRNKSYLHWFHLMAPPSGFLRRCPFHVFSSPNSEAPFNASEFLGYGGKTKFHCWWYPGKEGEDEYGKEAWRKPRFPQPFMTLETPHFFLHPVLAFRLPPQSLRASFPPFRIFSAFPHLICKINCLLFPQVASAACREDARLW